jgi:hypothetical protein
VCFCSIFDQLLTVLLFKCISQDFSDGTTVVCSRYGCPKIVETGRLEAGVSCVCTLLNNLKTHHNCAVNSCDRSVGEGGRVAVSAGGKH